MAIGTVKSFNAVRGYGFIQRPGGEADIFVHRTAVNAAGLFGLYEGQEVSFDVIMERGRPAATNLKLL